MSETTPVMTDLQRHADPRFGVTWVTGVQTIVLAVLVFLVYRRPIDMMVYKWQTDGNWSHGWLVPVFSLYFLWVHRAELFGVLRRASYFGLVVIVASLALYYLSVSWRIGYPQQFSLVPCIAGLVLLLCGWRVLKVAWFPIAFLVFAIPLPRGLYFDLTLPLRRIASTVAGFLLGFLPGVFTEVKGVVVDYAYEGRLSSLNVEEACSGMRLMMAFCSLGVAMAYLGDRPLWQRLVMVVCCVPIAVICNTIRVLITGVIHVYGFEDWSQGAAHELLGLAMLPIALGMFAFVGYVLKNIFIEDLPEEAGAA